MGEQGNNEAILIRRISSGVRLIDLCSFCIGGQKGNNMLACIMPLHESMSSNLPISKGYRKIRRNSEPDDRNYLERKQKCRIQRLGIVNLDEKNMFSRCEMIKECVIMTHDVIITNYYTKTLSSGHP